MKFKGKSIRVKEIHYSDKGLEFECLFVDENNLVHGSIRHRLLVTEDDSTKSVRASLIQLLKDVEQWSAKIHFDDVEENLTNVDRVFGIAETLGEDDTLLDDPA